jgi:pimeloyl-ACP methyl ester carboxylesterase
MAAAPASAASRYERRVPALQKVIIFVHGVTGDSISTWTNPKTQFYWPKALTKDGAFDGFNVYVYSYPSPILGKSFTIDEVSDHLRRHLDADRVVDHRELVFVAHSMGGLVVREFLLRYRRYAEKVKTLHFFATPTTGSPYARLAAKLSGNPQLGQLYPMQSDSYLARLQGSWLAVGLPIRSYCAYEVLETWGVMIVDRPSATNLCNQRLDAIPTNHIDIVKPEDQAADSYLALKTATFDLDATRPPPPPAQDQTKKVGVDVPKGKPDAHDAVASTAQPKPLAKPSPAEEAAWKRADEVSRIDAWQRYMAEWPNGFYSSAALERIRARQADRQLRTLQGHSGRVTGLAFSPDGKVLASGSADNTIKLWSTASWREVGTLLGHTGRVEGIAFSPDGKRVASASWDGTIRLWDANTRKEGEVLRGHSGSTWSVAFSPKGNLLASAGGDATVWDARTGKVVKRIERGQGDAFHVEFSRDGRLLVVSHASASIDTWDTTLWKRKISVQDAFHDGSRATISSSGKFLISSLGSQEISKMWADVLTIWGADSGKEIYTIKPPFTFMSSSPGDSIDAIQLFAGDRWAITSAPNGVRLWQLWGVGGAFKRSLSKKSAFRSHVAVSPDDKLGASGGIADDVVIWDLSAL